VNAFALTGAAFVACAIAGYLTGHLRSHHVDGMLALSYLPYWIRNFLQQDHLMAVVDAAGFAYFAWCWWNGGGGDDTKRRLRKWARKFQAVRRTAPAGAA
jgi:hypothetical protein